MSEGSRKGTHWPEMSFDRERMLRVRHARGFRVVCRTGWLWITEDGCLDDTVLAAGETAVLRSRGLALIQPLGTSDFEIFPPALFESTALVVSDESRRFVHRARVFRRRVLQLLVRRAITSLVLFLAKLTGPLQGSGRALTATPPTACAAIAAFQRAAKQKGG